MFGVGSGKWGRAGEEERRSGEGKCSGLRRRTVSRAGERVQYESDLKDRAGLLGHSSLATVSGGPPLLFSSMILCRAVSRFRRG